MIFFFATLIKKKHASIRLQKDIFFSNEFQKKKEKIFLAQTW